MLTPDGIVVRPDGTIILPDVTGHAPVPWEKLVPYEREQGGYWLYGPWCDVYGNGKVWVAVARPDTESIRSVARPAKERIRDEHT